MQYRVVRANVLFEPVAGGIPVAGDQSLEDRPMVPDGLEGSCSIKSLPGEECFVIFAVTGEEVSDIGVARFFNEVRVQPAVRPRLFCRLLGEPVSGKHRSQVGLLKSVLCQFQCRSLRRDPKLNVGIKIFPPEWPEPPAPAGLVLKQPIANKTVKDLANHGPTHSISMCRRLLSQHRWCALQALFNQIARDRRIVVVETGW